MNKNLKDIDIKVIKFILLEFITIWDGNISGITYEELDEAYLRLLKEKV